MADENAIFECWDGSRIRMPAGECHDKDLDVARFLLGCGPDCENRLVVENCEGPTRVNENGSDYYKYDGAYIIDKYVGNEEVVACDGGQADAESVD